MQGNLERGIAASRMRNAGRLAVLAEAGSAHRYIGALHPGPGGRSLRGDPPSRGHPRDSGAAVARHVTRPVRPATSGGAGGGGTPGLSRRRPALPRCAGYRLLHRAKWVETGAHAAHRAIHTRAAATKTTNAGAHLRGARKPPRISA